MKKLSAKKVRNLTVLQVKAVQKKNVQVCSLVFLPIISNRRVRLIVTRTCPKKSHHLNKINVIENQVREKVGPAETEVLRRDIKGIGASIEGMQVKRMKDKEKKDDFIEDTLTKIIVLTEEV